MHTAIAVFLVCATILVLSQPVAAFGAGDIPDFAYLNDRAFRHGDIENVLSTLAKNVGGATGSGGLMSIAASVLTSATGGSKFSKMDVKRVYFGNWLRDYSQAMDIAGLSKLTAQTLVTVVTVLGFMTFGFATAEFEVTADRLGVYLPIEHIDNPKGYAEKEGDARQFHPKLRPPVNQEELEINPYNGMKNYIATEGQSWDTSSAHVRRTLQQCIAYGRRAHGEETNDQWEAFRLLGTALHTLEDLLAHSNWCELSLRKMGHQEVFCYVGDGVFIDTPNGQAPPLVTGTFGSADFMHSVLGEGIDHLSEASVTNLTSKMDDAKNQGEGPISTLKSLFSKLPSSGDSSNEEKMEQAEDIKNKAYDFNPNDVAPEELQHRMWQVLEWRDSVYRDILKKIEMIPGLSELMDELTNALNAYVFTVLEPVLKPMLQQATGVLQDGSKSVIDTEDQFEVFTNPNASDPSHSILSKDHFGLILNEPAGKIAQVVVEYSVNLIVKAWYDESVDPDRVIDQILEAFHHPYFATGNSQIQRLMTDHLEKWIGGLGSDESQQVLQALTKESVRAGKNKRLGSNDDMQGGSGYDGEQQSRELQYTGAERYSAEHEVRYKPNPTSKPTYARYDGQSDQPPRSRRGDGEEYSSAEQYGNGRYNHGFQGEYAESEEFESSHRPQRPSAYGGYRDSSGSIEYEQPSRVVAGSEYSRAAYGRPEEASYSRERHTERHTERQTERYTERRDAEYDGAEIGGASYDAGGAFGQSAPSHLVQSEYGRFGSGRDAYAASQDAYGQEQSTESAYAQYSSSGRGGAAYDAQSHAEGRASYAPLYGGGYQSYGGEDRSFGGGNQSHRGGSQTYDASYQSYGGPGESQTYSGKTHAYRGGSDTYGGETQSYGGVSQVRTDDGYEGGRGELKEGQEAEYGGHTRSHRGSHSQRQRYSSGGDLETFGAEGLSLEDNGRRHVKPGYGRGLRRGVSDYIPEY